MKIIENILGNISQTKLNHNLTSSFENKSFVVFQIGSNYENSLSSSPHFQYQKQSKISDNESDSLPIPWIAAIIINAILVFLFIVFVIYCYCKSKKSLSFFTFLSFDFEFKISFILIDIKEDNGYEIPTKTRCFRQNHRNIAYKKCPKVRQQKKFLI